METLEKSNQSDGIVVVRPASETMCRQRLPYYVGISESTAGAKNISMNLIVIPPAGAAETHLHKGYETAIYLLKGRVKTCYGQKLEKSIICREAISSSSGLTCRINPLTSTPWKPALDIVARNGPTSRALCTRTDIEPLKLTCDFHAGPRTDLTCLNLQSACRNSS